MTLISSLTRKLVIDRLNVGSLDRLWGACYDARGGPFLVRTADHRAVGSRDRLHWTKWAEADARRVVALAARAAGSGRTLRIILSTLCDDSYLLVYDLPYPVVAEALGRGAVYVKRDPDTDREFLEVQRGHRRPVDRDLRDFKVHSALTDVERNEVRLAREGLG